MPKINSAGVPSYDGQTGTVTNAVGEQFEVNPSLDQDGERSDGYVNEPVGEFEESPAPGIPGDIRPVDSDDDEDTEPAEGEDGQPVDEPSKDDDSWDPARKPGNQTPSFDAKKPAKSTAPKKK